MPGSITLITGGMFAGKTEELARRIERVRIVSQMGRTERAIVFKPTRDTRRERAGERMDPVRVERPADILPLAEGYTVVGIDEPHFWNEPEEAEEVRRVCLALARGGTEVLVSVLNADFRGRPFLVGGLLFAIATDIVLRNAVCTACGADASFSQRVAGGQDTLQVGNGDAYRPCCVRCFKDPPTA